MRLSSHVHDDDRTLVAAARGGDAAAFAALHDRYASRVRRQVESLLRSVPAEVDDVVQETWLRAHRALPPADANLAFSAWLHTVAHRCAMDALRAGARRAADELDPERHVEPRSVADRVAERQARSEEHTSELQSRQYLVCRLLLEKKKIQDHL